MDAVAFLLLIQRRAGGSANIRDPLAAVEFFLRDGGETAQGKALRDVLRALATGNGEFSESAVWLFDQERLQLIAALIETRLSASYSRSEWDEYR